MYRCEPQYLVNNLFEGGKLGKLLEIIVPLHVAKKDLVHVKIIRVAINRKPWAEFRLSVWINICLWVISIPLADPPVSVIRIFGHDFPPVAFFFLLFLGIKFVASLG